jgi:hypothetical protein
MEKELEGKIKFVQPSASTTDLDQEPNMEEENVHEILRDVLNELHSKKTVKKLKDLVRQTQRIYLVHIRS